MCSFEVQALFVASLIEPLPLTQARMVCAFAVVVAEIVINAPATVPMIADRIVPPWQLRVFMPGALQYRRRGVGSQNIP
jgi:hypothetical protein